MSHDLSINTTTGVAEMFSVRETPWHQLGRVLTDAPATSAAAMAAAQMNWTADAHPVWSQERDGSFVQIDGVKQLRRSDNGYRLSIRANGYEVLQNAEAFAWFDPMIAAGEAVYETAGALRGGKVVWAMAKLTESFKVGNDDVVDAYLLLTNSFDGTQSIHARFTPVRVVCANTLGMALAAKTAATAARDTAVSIRHVKNAKDKLEEAKHVMGVVRAQMATTAQAYSLLAATTISESQLDAYLAQVFPEAPDAEYHGVTQKKRAAVRELVGTPTVVGRGLGAGNESARNTLWGAYNGVGDLVDYGSVINGAAAKKVASRVNSMWNGPGLKLKQRALSVALDMAGFDRELADASADAE